MEKYEIKADKEKNRMYIKLSGFFSVDEAKEAIDKAIEAMKQLKPGFEIINDGSELKTFAPEVIKELERGLKIAAEFGSGRVIRVISDPIAQMQWKRKERDAGVKQSGVAGSLEEADQMLDHSQ